jgi:MarR family
VALDHAAHQQGADDDAGGGPDGADPALSAGRLVAAGGVLHAAVIWQLHQQGPVTQRTLSQALRVSPRNVTGLLDALEAGGYVTRGRHPTDRRAQLMGVASDATDSEIDRAWAQGRAMSLEDAVASVRTF